MAEISGPVSMFVLELDGRRITIFGDYHYSKNFGCSDMGNPNIKRLNIDNVIHNWLLYNNDHGITTDLYIELMKKERLDLNQHVGWLYNLKQLGSKNYGPNVRIKNIDIRADTAANVVDTSDLFTWIFNMVDMFRTVRVLIPFTHSTIVDLLKFLLIIYTDGIDINGNITYPVLNLIVSAITSIDSFGNMSLFLDIVRNSSISDSMKNDITKAVFNMVRLSSNIYKGKYVHRTARVLDELKQKNNKQADAVRKYFDNILDDLVENIPDVVEHIYASLRLLANKYDFDSVTAVSVTLGKLAHDALLIGAITMDIYAICKLLLSNSTESIYYVGDGHALHYKHFLVKELHAKILFEQHNMDPYYGSTKLNANILSGKIDRNQSTVIKKLQYRCIDDINLRKYLDIVEMEKYNIEHGLI